MNLKAIGILLIIGFLAACSSIPKSESSKSMQANEPQVYIVDGAAHTPTEMEELANRNASLYYVSTPEATVKGQAYVFTKRAAYLEFRRQYTTTSKQELTAQTSCWTDLDTKTSLYKSSGYGGSVLKLVKGSSYDKYDLGSFDQAISSVKGACSVWTDLYDGWYFTGTTWSTFGNNFTGLPSWIDNDTSSVKVGQ